VAIKNVSDSDDLMIINRSGLAIRMSVDNLRVMGRATQGVRLINLKSNDAIAAVAKVMKDDEEVVEELLEELTDTDISDENSDGTTIADNNEDE
jgi:DNA gyrase subunit A